MQTMRFLASTYSKHNRIEIIDLTPGESIIVYTAKTRFWFQIFLEFVGLLIIEEPSST